MAISDRTKEENNTIGFKKSEGLLLPQTSLASLESLTIPLVQEVVLLADFQCEECQKRVANIISKMNGETESVVVSVLEKKITLTGSFVKAHPPTSQIVAANSRKPINKVAMITRLFRSSPR
ncbi:hypothetical protein ACSBR2_035970 [Camellia fascicularis]